MNLDWLEGYTPRRVTSDRREAAVLVPVIDRGDERHLLFTKRSDDLRSHPGQMSFPGGGREPRDEDLRATALREANEEVGLEPTEARVVGQLDDLPGVKQDIRPYVARIPDRAYVPDGIEVAEIVVLPLSSLLDPTNYEYEHRSDPERGEFRIDYFHVNGYTVWGLTGHILSQLLQVTTDWRPPGS